MSTGPQLSSSLPPERALPDGRESQAAALTEQRQLGLFLMALGERSAVAAEQASSMPQVWVEKLAGDRFLVCTRGEQSDWQVHMALTALRATWAESGVEVRGSLIYSSMDEAKQVAAYLAQAA